MSLRIRTLSDLHFEFHADEGKGFVEAQDPRGVDLVILAGDITKMRLGFYKMLKLFRDRFPAAEIVWTHGNHEMHESDRKTVVRTSKDAISHLKGVHWLDCDVIEVKGHRILGTPLWFSRKPAPQHPLLLSTDEEWARGVIRTVTEKGIHDQVYCDFEAIENLDTWVYEENGRAVRFLYDNMREGDIVVTHFLPTQKSVAQRFKGALSNCWFVSDVEQLIKERKPALVIHGHTHDSFDYMIGSTRILSNPFGYVPQALNQAFIENLNIEVI